MEAEGVGAETTDVEVVLSSVPLFPDDNLATDSTNVFHPGPNEL
jgi:hypothetical protein